MAEENLRQAYSIKAFSEALSISTRTTYYLIQKAKLKTIQIGRRRVIPARELNRILQQGVK